MALFHDGGIVQALPIERGATLSPCRTYRYRLWRTWQPSAGFVCWVMLNPSTADETRDDPTIRRCINFARAWGYGGIEVVNLFALRATNWMRLYGHVDPIGPENDRVVLDRAEASSRLVVAWGQHGDHWNRGTQIAKTLATQGRRLECLGHTKDGQPRHPLYIKGDAPLVPFSNVELKVG